MEFEQIVHDVFAKLIEEIHKQNKDDIDLLLDVINAIVISDYNYGTQITLKKLTPLYFGFKGNTNIQPYFFKIIEKWLEHENNMLISHNLFDNTIFKIQDSKESQKYKIHFLNKVIKEINSLEEIEKILVALRMQQLRYNNILSKKNLTDENMSYNLGMDNLLYKAALKKFQLTLQQEKNPNLEAKLEAIHKVYNAINVEDAMHVLKVFSEQKKMTKCERDFLLEFFGCFIISLSNFSKLQIALNQIFLHPKALKNRLKNYYDILKFYEEKLKSICNRDETLNNLLSSLNDYTNRAKV
ncbi:MAG: hypothetical protein KBD31_00935 [Proteobacteria bacterium]|nr:hypothetical protein [Pseudomonadota bacterium]